MLRFCTVAALPVAAPDAVALGLPRLCLQRTQWQASCHQLLKHTANWLQPWAAQPQASMPITARPSQGLSSSDQSSLFRQPLAPASGLVQYAAPARPRPVSNIAHGRTIIAPSQTLHGRKLRSPRRGVSPVDSRDDACAMHASLIRGKHASKTPDPQSCGHFWRVQTLI